MAITEIALPFYQTVHFFRVHLILIKILNEIGLVFSQDHIEIALKYKELPYTI